mmetsp:Transcript_19509/g.21158  ORF Transcript_19509/g.21158 Transcript_19509/m.21158 type:complete len:555 (-) Transcript_19509:159-1823(-)
MSPLENLLNQVSYTNRRRVKDDIKAVMERYKSLLPRIAKFVQNNGTESKVISLNGTVPITYSGVQYNIPLEVFIVERYPLSPPKAFLRPTSNMTVKPNHRHADLQGCIYLPYLHEWKQESNLIGLLEICSTVFSFDPPLFSKPTGPSAAVNPPSSSTAASGAAVHGRPSLTEYNPASTTYAQPVVSGSLYPTSTTATTAVAANTTNYSTYNPNTTNYNNYNYNATTSTYPNNGTMSANGGNNAVNLAYGVSSTTSQPHSTQTSNKISETEKHENLLLEVTSKIQQEIYRHQEQLKKDIDNEFSNQRYLEKSSKQLHQTKDEYIALIEQLQDGIINMNEKTKQLNEWDNNESSKEKNDLEDFIFSYDDLSNQIIKLNSECNAIDDIFYFLQKSLVNKKIDCNTFLRESRQLSRKQFLFKSHLLKIQNQLSMMIPPPPVPNNINHSPNGVGTPPYLIGPNGSGTTSPQMTLVGQSPQVHPHTMVHPSMTVASQQQIQSQYPGMSTPTSGPYIHGINQHATNRTQQPTMLPNVPQINAVPIQTNPAVNNNYAYYNYK